MTQGEAVVPVEPTPAPPAASSSRSRRPRLARHTVEVDGARVTVSVCGRGLPLVLVHGWSAEGALYAHTLARLVDQGYQVVTIDWAGFSRAGDGALADGATTMSGYHRLLARTLAALGIRRAILAGHSMGGRLVADLAADDPDLAIAVILIDAATGQPWDDRMRRARAWPPTVMALGASVALDIVTTTPLRDPPHALRLGLAAVPMAIGHIRHPTRLFSPAVALIAGAPSVASLKRLRQEGVAVVVLHADHDLVVPLATGRSTAELAGAELVVVRNAGHSWLIKDPEALPAVMRELRAGSLGRAVERAVRRARRPRRAGGDGIERDDLEQLFTTRDALVGRLAGSAAKPLAGDLAPRPARYQFAFPDRADGASGAAPC